MAFQTGTAADIDELINTTLRNFAVVTNAWTANATDWPNHLALSNNNCFVNLRRRGSALFTPTGDNTFNDVFGNSITDNRCLAHLSSGYVGTGATPDDRYLGQPDSRVTTSIDTDANRINDVTGPLTSYSLYSGGPNDEEYIYLVTESSSGYYNHLGFGNIDQLTATYSPGSSFLISTFYQWWPSVAAVGSRFESFFSSASHDIMFGDRNLQYYLGGADAGNLQANKVKIRGECLPLFRAQNSGTANEPLSGGANDGRWADSLPFLGPNPLNGVTPFIPIPAAVLFDTPANAYFLLGVLPNIRLCSMKGRLPGETVTLGDDQWDVYPFRRQRDDNGTVPEIELVNAPPYENTSAQYGVAYKRVT